MKFSVILPVYNREKRVEKAINSVIEQTLGDWELVIINDGSTDNTLQVCDEFARKDSRIKVISQENQGVSAARNTALKAAEGEYIMFLDSDDTFLADAMADFDKIIDGNNMPDMVCGGYCTVMGGGWKPAEDICGKLHDKQFIYENVLPEHVNAHPQTKYFIQPYLWNKCFRREMISESNILFDPTRRTWGDNGFVVSCLAKSVSLFLTDCILLKVDNTNSGDHLSAMWDDNRLTGYIKSYKEYTEQFGSLYNFDNPYTNTRYFTFTCNMLGRLQAGMKPEQFDRTLENVLNNQYAQIWFGKAEVSDRLAARIMRAFNSKKIRLLKKLLKKQHSPSESIWLKIKKLLSRIKRKILK